MKDGFTDQRGLRPRMSLEGHRSVFQLSHIGVASAFRGLQAGLNRPIQYFLRSPANQPVFFVGCARDFT